MRPADVCGCCTYPSSSRRATMLRTVADDTPSPAAVTRSEDATGSPDAMYSRMSAARTRFDLSAASCDIYGWQSLEGTAKTLYIGTAAQLAVETWALEASRRAASR